MLPILLIQPPGACRAFTRSGSVYPPLGLCQLAATVDPSVCQVLDADGLDLSEEQALEQALAFGPRMVGLSATSATLDLVESWAARVARAGIRVVAGGPHASLEPEDLLQRCPSVEAAVRGEAESVFGELARRAGEGLDLTGLPGVLVRGGRAAEVVVQRVPGFEGLPFPRYDGLPIGAYHCPDARRRPMVTVMTTRGCPHACAFCSSSFLLGRKVRGWPVDAVLDHLERLVWAHGVQEISFVDDVFTIRRERTLALCRGLCERGLDLSWFCNARADQVDPELAQAMAAAGCHQVYLGFESGSQAILDGIHKGAQLDRLEAGAATLAEAGIGRSVGFVVGLPGETDATVAQTVALAWRLRPERLQFTAFTPLPGTPLARERLTGTFHLGADEQVVAWVHEAYAACAGQPWGRRSW